MLELNTATATMREVLEKVVKRKLGVTGPVIMQGANLLHESGEDIEEDMVAYYDALLDKVQERNCLLYMVFGLFYGFIRKLIFQRVSFLLQLWILGEQG